VAVLATGCGTDDRGRETAATTPANTTVTVSAAAPAATADDLRVNQRTPAGPPSVSPVSEKTRAATKSTCKRYTVKLRQVQVTGGLDGYIDQLSTIRDERERMADRMEREAGSQHDLQQVVRYTSRIRANNTLLAKGLRLARDNKIPEAFGPMHEFNERVRPELKLLDGLRLVDCNYARQPKKTPSP